MAGITQERLCGEEQANRDAPRHRDPLLRTKLFAPQAQSGLVARPRLFDHITGGLDNPLILVTAPAGYGKTTLLSSWLRQARIPSAWISLDENDNDPVRFLHYLITALQKIVPAVQLDLLGALQHTALLNFLINTISEQAPRFVLVLDDLHTIHAQPVLDMLTHLVEHMPPQMHIALLSRSDPPLPISRLRVRHLVTEIRANQLRFTADEIAIFLNETNALGLSPVDIAALEARTEGWIASLQLAAVAMLAGKDVHAFVTAFTGSHYYIMDYLTEEVLSLQPEAVRLFLLCSSILERMCGPLCEALLDAGQAIAGSGQAMLEALEQSNLFIIPLDSERRWYRYHHLFADVLNRRLEMLHPQLLPDLHRRAASWYKKNGYIFDAIRHTLLAGDMEQAAHLVERNGCSLLMRGEVVTLLRWIEAVEPYSQTLAWIAIQKGWAFALTGQPERAEEPLQAASRMVSVLPPSDARGTMLGAIYAARALRHNLQGETRQAVEYARQSLEALPVSNDISCSLRSVATSVLGDACRLEGNLAEARGTYSDAVRISQGEGNCHMTIIANCNLADILLEEGQLQQAGRIFSEMALLARLPDGQISPLIDRVCAGLSRVSYETNRLDEAQSYAQQCIEASRRCGNSESLALGLVVAAWVEHSQNCPEKALEFGRAAEQLVTHTPLAAWRAVSIRAAVARLWIARGDLERASDLVEQAGISADGDISFLQKPVYINRLRLHLARGEVDAALTLSGRLLHIQAAQQRMGSAIEILVLQALAFQAKKEMEQALSALDQAFSLGRPQGYVRVFLDEGQPMAKLLYQARSRRISAGYASELLAAAGAAFGAALPPARLLIQPLTPREVEVLQLIEAGCSNQQIANKYVISIPTVKRHISNIYMKLEVSSRTQAVSRAKELGLLN